MCTHVSSIVSETNHNGAICLFMIRSSLETRQIIEDWFFSNSDGLSQKIYHIYQKQNVITYWASIKDSI